MRDDGDIVSQTVRTKQMSVYETAEASGTPKNATAFFGDPGKPLPYIHAESNVCRTQNL